ncbi:hypothetical protein [Tessaracoccus coleopterorum]|uniref:hypothetical protein n=1 Tax=Tessaracoccus coleopterorum TaxID=2714950 RepID=UPI0018D456CA|nr:hypothetical protein [Tessaracoccus coleopterorum]
MSHHDHADVEPRQYWDERYGDTPIWSGKVNAVLGEVATGLEPGPRSIWAAAREVT